MAIPRVLTAWDLPHGTCVVRCGSRQTRRGHGDFRRVLMITDPVFYAAAIPAVTLMGLAKGGFSGIGILALPLMALVVSPVQSAAILLPILIVQDAVTVWAYRRTWDPRNVAILLAGALVGILA